MTVIIDSHVKRLVFLFPFGIPSSVNWMFLIPDTFLVLPGGRWDIPPQGRPPAPRAPSLDHGFPEGFSYGLVPRVGGVNFQWVSLVALDKE